MQKATKEHLAHVMERPVRITGPVDQPAGSHPFSAMKFSRSHIRPEDWGYLEEEYFFEGQSGTYDLDKEEKLVLAGPPVPFCTRILVRRPAKRKQQRPRVFLDILNASNGYDIEDQWRRSWRYIMENGFSYVGITAKPVNVLALKYFNWERYKALDWSGGERAALPAVPDSLQRIEGCEEGMIWDMLTELGAWIKGDGRELFASGGEKLYLYLTGQSQSGMYLNTYVYQFHPLLSGREEPVFDGYLSLVSGGLQRSLRQTKGEDTFMCIRPYPEHAVDVPFISLNSEGDYGLFSAMGMPGLKRGTNGTGEGDKRRYYEAAGAPHTDAASPLVPENGEIEKCKCPRRILDGEYTYRLNDFPLDYLVNGMLEKLHRWAAYQEAPKEISPLVLDGEGVPKRDVFGNALGGIRTAFLEVPKASYAGSRGPGETNGTMRFFTQEEMRALYGETWRETYKNRFEEVARGQLKAGDIVETDLLRMLQWAENVLE